MKLCCAPGCDDVAGAGLPRCLAHEDARLARQSVARRAAKASPAAKAGAKLYATARWQSGRVAWLSRFPLCAQCEADGLVVAAGEVDHVTPHRGDEALFFDHTNWQSLCKRCHSRKTAREVFAGVRFGYSIPHGIRPSVVPVVLVGGPPGAGKSTYVAAHKGPRDLVIDLDEYLVRLGGRPWDQDKVRVRAAFGLRDHDLLRLCEPVAPKAWVVMVGADAAERAAWLRALGLRASWVVIAPPRDEVVVQIMADPARVGRRVQMIAVADGWYRANP
jgi:5-methylcytosine-specific restriction protein A